VSLGLEFAGVVRSDGNHFCGGQRGPRRHAPVQGREGTGRLRGRQGGLPRRAPRRTRLSQAAALPIGMETALTAFDKAGLRRGGNVLVHGASGGVGVYAVQIAAAAGAT